MTDNNTTDYRATELVSYREARILLLGFLCEYQNILISRRINASEAVCKQNELIDEYAKRIEQAIAATLGSGECAKCAEGFGAYADSLCDPLKEQMDKLIHCLENDYGIKASWDGLRKVWLTEAIEPRDGTAAALGRGECKWREAVVGGRTEGYECECGHMMPEVPRFCPNCGWKAVKR